MTNEPDKVNKNSLTEVFNSILSNRDKELYEKTEAELESYWYFQWNDKRSIEYNIYDFYKMLDLYNHHVRDWEQHHNGNCCVVERVRDKYLMPKITKFKNELFSKIQFEDANL